MDNKLSYPEFQSLLSLLLVDRIFPDFVFIPGLGIRWTFKSFKEFSEDLYKAYQQNGAPGIAAFMEKTRHRPDVNLAALATRSLALDRIKKLGITDQTEQQKVISDFYASDIPDINSKSDNPDTEKE